jgi:hypothetical protein
LINPKSLCPQVLEVAKVIKHVRLCVALFLFGCQGTITSTTGLEKQLSEDAANGGSTSGAATNGTNGSGTAGTTGTSTTGGSTGTTGATTGGTTGSTTGSTTGGSSPIGPSTSGGSTSGSSTTGGSSGSSTSGAGATGPQLGLFEEGSCTCNDTGGPPALAVMEQWLGRPILYAEDFSDDDKWSDFTAPNWQMAGWQTWKQADPRRVLVLAPGMGVTQDIPGGATGTYDTYWQALGQGLVDKGLDDTIIRLAHEFSGGWYWYSPSGQEQDFINYWQHAVTAMRAVPGQHFRFFWNPTAGVGHGPAPDNPVFLQENGYPGDDYVDLIGPDIYDSDYSAYPTIGPITQAMWDAAWNNTVNGDHGLAWFATFAAQHEKPLAIGEWGLWDIGAHHGGGDDPDYIQRVHDWAVQNNVVFYVYFNVTASDGDHELYPNVDFPNASALFQSLFQN